jgi:hypothetical protein
MVEVVGADEVLMVVEVVEVLVPVRHLMWPPC